MKVDLQGKVAVVTGGAGVLCGYFAKALAQNGAAVAVLDLKAEAAEGVAGEITAAGGKAIGVACNVLEPTSIREAERKVREALGPYHILINGAGSGPASACTTDETAQPDDVRYTFEEKQTFFNLPHENVRSLMDINFIGSYLSAQVFAEGLMEQKGAVIINISSMSALSPLTKQPAYSASKAALTNFNAWLATHLAPCGIRVNAIAPGFFATDINHHLLFDKDGEYTARSAKIIAGTPMGRFGEPDELVGAMLFLCDSSSSGFITGATIPVDGGFSAYCGV